MRASFHIVRRSALAAWCLTAAWTLSLLCLAPSRADAQGSARTHEVRAGDTLWSIAKRYGCRSTDLELANPRVDPERLRIGQRIDVPPCPATGAAAPSPAPPAKARPRGAGERQHKVRAGEYLERIARRYDCSVEAIQRANGLRSDVIYAGSTLIIPRCAPGDTLAPPPPVVAPPEPVRRPPPGTVDHHTLPKLMRARGFKPPPKFKAFVHLVEFDAGRHRVVREASWDWEGTGHDVVGWNPASTVKLFAAIGALMRLQQWRFGPDAQVTFHGRAGDKSFRVRELVTEALGPSNNIAYNYLVLLSGHDWLHGSFFTPRYGLDGGGLRRAYEKRRWMQMGESSSFTDSPAITLSEGTRRHSLPERHGEVRAKCHSAACASLAMLAECMRRLMLQEQLPASQTFGLDRELLLLLRSVLRTERKRGEEVVSGLAKHFGGDAVRLYHKAGFAEKWYSDVVYVYDPRQPRAWIVALAGHPGRSALDRAADVIGDLLAERALR